MHVVGNARAVREVTEGNKMVRSITQGVGVSTTAKVGCSGRPWRRSAVARGAGRQEPRESYPDSDENFEKFSSTNTASIPKLVVKGLTFAVNSAFALLPGGGSGRPAGHSQDSRPPISPEDLLEGLRSDYEDRNYLFTGDVDPDLYAIDCVFTDPTISFQGLETFQKNLENLSPIVDFFLQEGKTTLYSIALDEPGRRVTARWRMLGTFRRFPAFWGPELDVKGQTVFTFDDESGRVVDYRETWATEPGEALRQLLVPAARGEGDGE